MTHINRYVNTLLNRPDVVAYCRVMKYGLGEKPRRRAITKETKHTRSI